ncbi:hypothetical protein PFISCL1PPCAC_13125, partial [Pristionchus fissidentatus]
GCLFCFPLALFANLFLALSSHHEEYGSAKSVPRVREADLPMSNVAIILSVRRCLVCNGETRVSHLGLDLCRACTVFHRRSQNRTYACQSNTDGCAVNDGSSCRKCRFREIDKIIPPMTSSDSIFTTVKTIELSVTTVNEETQGPSNVSSDTRLGILERVSRSYRVLCETRLTGELSARACPPHPLEMNDDDFTPIAATQSACDHANRIFISSLLHFGSSAFPEFQQLKKEEKWIIITHFFYRFRIFETGYRADKLLPGPPDRTFSCYTMYVDTEIARSFYQDEAANRCMRKSLERDIPMNRERFHRLKLHREEFLAVATLMFWDIASLGVSHDLISTGELYRERVMNELHAFYRSNLSLDNYAARMGELLTFPGIYQRLADEMNSKFELLRLLNVFTDDTLIYRVSDRK